MGHSLTLLLGAMRLQADILMQWLEDGTGVMVAGKRFVFGRIAGHPVIVATCGVGKVNAAMVTAMALTHFAPTAVICAGVAGSLYPDAVPGDVVIAERVAQYDLGRRTAEGFQVWQTWDPLIFEQNPLFFPADAALLHAARTVAGQVPLETMPEWTGNRPQVRLGTMITGDTLVTSAAHLTELREQFAADACEVEGGAIAHVCWQLGVGCLIVRGISDVRGHIPTWRGPAGNIQACAELAACNAARVVVALLESTLPQVSVACQVS